MGLSCSCDDYYPDPGDTVCYAPTKYEPMNAKRRKRCLSCNSLIDIGATAARVDRYKIPDSDIECRIFGEDGEVPKAPGWLCECCADLFFSLDELGFCVNPHDDMRALVRDYATDYGPQIEVMND